jgi:hypothetical protein
MSRRCLRPLDRWEAYCCRFDTVSHHSPLPATLCTEDGTTVVCAREDSHPQGTNRYFVLGVSTFRA